MLKRIKIQGYKSLEDVEVSLENLSVLFGPNSAGKSNFLDALQLLSRFASSRTLKEAFQPPYRGNPLESFTFGNMGIKSLLKKDTIRFNFEVDIYLSNDIVESVNSQIVEMRRTKPEEPDRSKLKLVRERNLRYRIGIEILPKSGILRVMDEYIAALNREGEPIGNRAPFLGKNEEETRLHLRMEGQSHPTYYDLGLDHSVLSSPLYPPYYPHLTAMRQELASWFFYYFEPRERMRASNPVKEVRHIGMMGEELAAFLNTLRALDPRQFEAVEKALSKIIPSVTGIDVGVNDLGEVELKLLEGKTPIPSRVLSEGTLRILGLLALGGAKEPPALVGFEEPENGIHPRRIEMVANLLKTRTNTGDTQFIVTTHSPLLPDRIPRESLYICQKKDSHTVIEPLNFRYPPWSPADINRELNKEEELSISKRIIRGDFDA